MGLSLALDSLESRIVRVAVAGDDGIRRVAPNPENKDKGFLGTLLEWGKGLLNLLINATGWIVKTVWGGLSFTASAIWSLTVQTATFVYNFNWNASDAQLNQQLTSLKNIIAAQLGGTLGNLAGYLACGVLPAAGILYFNEALGLRLLKEVGEEALDEFLGNLGVLVKTSLNFGIQWLLTKSYQAGRGIIKKVFNDPSSWQSKFLKKILGENITNVINAWGDGTRPWSYRQKVEEGINAIENPFLQNFVEEFYDEFLDSCVEAGYVLAGGIDAWVLEQKEANRNILGRERTVQFQPDRTIENERIVLHGNELLIRQALPQVMANYQIMENRDVGQIIGAPVQENIGVNTSPISLKLVFYSVQTPPFNQAEVIAQYSIPDVKKSKLDWEDIKFACGGKNGYSWGRYRATALLDNRRQLQVYAGSESEAEDRINAFIALSEAEILSLSIAEEKKTGMKANGKPLQKETTKIYPAYMTVVTAQKVLNEQKGKPTLQGNYSYRRNRIELWTDTKPDNFNEIIQELLYVPGVN